MSVKKRAENIIDWLSETFSGARFPVFMIVLMLCFEIIMMIFLAIPSGEQGVGLFARDFKTWCFNYDPATGTMDWFYVSVMLTQPLLLSVMIYFVWKGPLRDAFHVNRHEMGFISGSALICALLIGGSFTLLGAPEPSAADYPFPAERLRTQIVPPQFELIDQEGQTVNLGDLQNKVVLVTGVYARCSGSCPIIITEIKRVTDRLSEEEKAAMTVVAITLNPERDTPEEMAAMAKRHGVEKPLYRLVTGEPQTVHTILDKFSFSRIPNEESGEIDHANLFILIDQKGQIAYRLSLGDRTEQWLDKALRILLREAISESIASL